MAVDLDFEFDPSTIPPDEFERLPIGRYLVQCVETEMVDTKSGDGRMLKAVFDVMDGNSQGRKWFENYNLRNPNADAERIGNQQFEKLKVATGCGGQRISNTSVIEFKPFFIDVGERKNNKTGEMERVIKAYSAYSAPGGPAPRQQAPQQNNQQRPQQTSQPQQNAQPAQTPQQAQGGGSRPWRR